MEQIASHSFLISWHVSYIYAGCWRRHLAGVQAAFIVYTVHNLTPQSRELNTQKSEPSTNIWSKVQVFQLLLKKFWDIFLYFHTLQLRLTSLACLLPPPRFLHTNT